jgi:Uma2 family endonuclease
MSEKAIGQTAKSGSVEDFPGTKRNAAESTGGNVLGHSGSDRWHNLIVSNVAVGLGSRMHGHKNEIYISNMRLKLRNGLICYPDISIVAGEPAFTDQRSDVLLNPTVIVDIFSGNSDSMEKTKKLESFLESESVKEVILIKQDEMRIEHFARQNQKQWIYRIYNERDDVASLDSVNCKISLQEVYANIKFRQAEFSSKAVN